MRAFASTLAALTAACATAPSPVPVQERSPEPWMRSPPPEALAPPTISPPAIADSRLSNGLRVVVVEHHRRAVVSLALVFPEGAAADPPEHAGRTWLAVMLAGDFHEQSPDGRELVEERSFRGQVAEAGGAAFFDVGADASTVGISGYARDTAWYLEMLADAMVAPRHGAASFASRRNATLGALEDLELDDPAAFSLLLSQSAFGSGHPYARPVEGTVTSLAALGLELVIARQHQLFAPEGAVLLVVGDVEGARVVRDAQRVLGPWSGAPPAPPKAIAPPAVLSRRPTVAFIRREPASTLAVCAARPLPDLRGSDAELALLATILGQGLGSRMAALREQNGLAYDASAAVVERRHARLFVACARVRGDRGGEGIRILREILSTLAVEGPTETEVARARAKKLADLESAGDDAPSLLSHWLEALTLGSPSPDLVREQDELVHATRESVRAAARRVLAPDTLQWILSGEARQAAQAVEANRLGTLLPVSFAR